MSTRADPPNPYEALPVSSETRESRRLAIPDATGALHVLPTTEDVLIVDPATGDTHATTTQVLLPTGDGLLLDPTKEHLFKCTCANYYREADGVKCVHCGRHTCHACINTTEAGMTCPSCMPGRFTRWLAWLRPR